MIKLVPRTEHNPIISASIPVIAVALTMFFGGILFWMLGKDPFETIRMIFWDPLMNETFADYARPQILVKAAPLILIAIGLSFGFKANIWNIGAEGQFIMGAIFSGSLGLAFYPTESTILFPLMIAFGITGGVLWALIPAVLRTYFNTNEILVSLMLVYVAEQVLAAASIGFLRNPDGAGFPGSRNLSQYPSAANLEIVSGTGIHWGVATALISVIFFYILLYKHKFGFQVALSGMSPKAARLSGINPRSLIIFCLALSGGLAGLAGMFELTGPSGQITIDFNVGYGFTAIIVAFLGRLNPVGILFSGILMALTYVGGELTQFMLNLPAAAIQVFQGMLLFFLLSMDILVTYKIKLRG